jgi:hypothetical protein
MGVKAVCAAAVMSIGLAVVVNAAPPGKQVAARTEAAPLRWEQEPSAVLGVLLGASLESLQLPECSQNRPSALCIAPKDWESQWLRRLYGTPDLGVPYAAWIATYDGKVRSLTLSLRRVEFPKMKAMLIERYGRPTKAEAIGVTTYGGANLDAELLIWAGENTTIVALERAGTIDESSVEFQSNAVEAAKRAAEAAATKNGASKL